MEREFTLPTYSVTRLLDYLFSIWPFTTMKICPKTKQFAKVCSKFCQIFSKQRKNCQSGGNIAKSGHTGRARLDKRKEFRLTVAQESSNCLVVAVV